MKNMNTIQNVKVTVYRMINGDIARQSWGSLQKGVRKAFREVLKTANNEECYVFSYCDAQVEFSAACMVKYGEAVFYLQDAAAEDTATSFYAHNYSHGSLEVVK